MSEDPVTWTEKQDNVGQNKEMIYADKTGTRRELLEAIRRDGPVYIYHQFVSHT